MKLFTAKVSFDFVVVAEDESHAYVIARDSAREALGDMPFDAADLDVSPGVHASGWDDECIPYGGDGNTRTGEYKQMENAK
jgi:hypothetical protein